MNLDHFRNEDGTYNSAAAMSRLTELDQEEILWTFNRLKELIPEIGKDAAKAKVAEEAKLKPWTA